LAISQHEINGLCLASQKLPGIEARRAVFAEKTLLDHDDTQAAPRRGSDPTVNEP
jgi:hypothetical protein